MMPGESKRKDRSKTIKDQPGAGRAYDVIAGLKPDRRRAEAVATCIRYYEANNDRMRCDICRKRGLPVGSGVAERACKRIVGSGFKGAQCHWSKAGADALLAANCCFKNNRCADFLDSRACSAAAACPKNVKRTRFLFLLC